MRATLDSYLDDFLSRGDATALAYRRGLRTLRTSYRDLALEAFRFSRELEERGVGKGDRILLQGKSGAEWIAAFLGCLVRGAVSVPLDADCDIAFAGMVARQTEPRLAVIDSAEIGPGAFACPAVRFEDLAATISCHPAEPRPAARLDPDDALEIVFTSGTTAEPKGVLITRRNLLANLGALEREIAPYLKYERLVHPLRFLSLVPLSHVFGQIMGMFVPQMTGGEVHFQESLGPSRIIETIRRERISVLVAVPRMLDTLREKIVRDAAESGGLDEFHRLFEEERGRFALRRWWRFRAIHSRFGWKFWAFISGGAALSPETEEFWDRLGFAVIQGYGMTETASLISVNHPLKLARGSIGKAMPHLAVKLASDGEILVRGESVTPGYWGRVGAEVTAGDGWLHTGDIGEMDADGNLYFKGRAKDVIVTSAGIKIHPGDIERAFDREPEVRASAVISAEGSGGPEPLVALALRGEADARELVDRVNRTLAPHQRIRKWFVWPEDDFPRTPTQKIVKRLVAERALSAGPTGVRGAEESRVAAGIEAIVSRLGGGMGGKRDPAARLGSDIGLDSLGRVELLDAVEERYRIDLDEAALTEDTTLGDLERLVRGGRMKSEAPYPYPRWQRRPPLSWLRIAILELVAMPAARLFGRQSTIGRERLKNVRSPVVIVCNHITAVDHALALLALPGRMRRRTAIAMDGEILRAKRYPPPGTPLLIRLSRAIQYALVVLCFNVFSMPRRSGFRRSFEYAGELLDRGCNLLVFPEGRYTEDGSIGSFMPGTGLLVSKAHAPVIPLRIEGLWELKSARRRRARPGEIFLEIGEPVVYRPHDTPERIAADLRERVTGLGRGPAGE